MRSIRITGITVINVTGINRKESLLSHLHLIPAKAHRCPELTHRAEAGLQWQLLEALSSDIQHLREARNNQSQIKG